MTTDLLFNIISIHIVFIYSIEYFYNGVNSNIMPHNIIIVANYDIYSNFL